MITAARLKAVVTADTGQARTNLKEFGREVDNTASKTQRGVRGILDAFNGLPGPLGALSGALSVAGFATAAIGAVKFTAALDNQRQVAANVRKELVAYAGGAEQAARAAEAVSRATEGGISKLEAQAQASKLLGMGLVQNADQAYTMARMAVMLGDKMLSATDRMASWNAMLANQSIERLDTFGISSGRVRARIDEMTKAMPGLSRETAFVNAVMEIGAGKLQAVEDAGVDAATSMDTLRSAVSDLKQMAADGVNIEIVVTGLSDAVGGFTDMLAGRRTAQIAFDVDAKTVDRIQAIEDGIARLEETKKRFNDGSDLSLLKQGMADIQITELANLRSQLLAYGTSAETVRGKLDDYLASSLRLAQAQDEVNKISIFASSAVKQMAQAELEAAQAARDSSLAAYQAAEGYARLAVDTDEAAAAQYRYYAAARTAASAPLPGRRFDDDLGLADRMSGGKSSIAPATPIRGSKAWNEAQAADKARSEYLNSLNKDTAKKAGKSYLDAMTAAGKEAATRITGYLQEGMNFSINLDKMQQANPLAPGQNGAFEEIYRLQAWLKDGSWGDTAAKLGGDRERIAGTVRSFQMGNFTPDVLSMVDLPGLRKMLQDQVAAEASQQALAGQLGGDTSVLKSLLGIDTAGQGVVLAPDESAALVKSLSGSMSESLKNSTLGVDMVSAMLTSMSEELKADGGEQLKTKGAEAFDKVGEGFVARAKASPVFYRAVGAIVDSYIASELEQ